MRIAVFAKSTLAHGMGGMETHLDNLCRELVARGHAVEVVTTGHPAGIPVEEQRGLRVHYLTETPPRLYCRAWWRRSRQALDELLATGPVDLIFSEALAAAAVVRARRRPPVAAFVHGLELSHIVSEWHQGSGVRHLLRLAGIKIPEMAYYAFVHERPLLRRAEAVLAIHDPLARALARRCRRVFIAYNGVDVRCFAPDEEHRRQVRKRLGITEGEPVVLLAAVLTRQKGIHVGVEALAGLAGRVPGLRLVVVGAGPEEGTLRALAAGSPLGPRSDFIGGVPPGEMPSYFNAADLFLHPSLRAEGLPTVILEAMASGLPVVATDAGGTRTAVLDGETGILIPKGDVGRLAAAVEALCTDRALARRLGVAGLRLARERFAWSHIVDRLLADLAGLTRGR